jgi:hypothetical protein
MTSSQSGQQNVEDSTRGSGYLWLEAKVETAVNFINYKNGDPLKVTSLAGNEVNQSARCGYRDLNASLQSLHLSVLLQPSKRSTAPQLERLRKPTEETCMVCILLE